MAASHSTFDPQPPDKSGMATGTGPGSAQPSTMAMEAGQPEGLDLLAIMGRAEQISKDYQSRTIERPLSRAYRAWGNQHAEGSKYLGTAWKGRTKLFVPKTRSAVRKNLATAAAALFSTEDVVNVAAEYEDDDVQRATAAVMKADLDYRLTRSSAKSGIPWYQIAMGACLDGQLTGCSISKQFWEYEEVDTGETEAVFTPMLNEATGEPILDLDETTGEMVPVMVETDIPKKRVVKDRPMIELYAIENAGLDPAAPWYSPAQLGRWFYMDHPMGLSDAKAMMASASKSGQDSAWLDVPDAVLLKGRQSEERTGARRVREGGGDRYQDGKAPGELDIVWLRENFVRIEGIDYHFWSVGRHAFVSKVRQVYEAYPEFDGERPYVFGVSQLDTHRVFPMSPVEAWQPLQLELNDIVNLRLDTLKRAIAPIAKVKRGKNVDLAQVQRRGQPETVLLLDDPEKDVSFEATPGPSGAAYTETSQVNAAFDELAGVFSTSSVQTSRQLNETVGGMRLMSGAANAVSEFDLRMWIETWVEPVLRQVMHLIRANESDEKLLRIAGAKAKAWKEFGYLPTLSDFEATEISLRVNAGIGALDPMQKMAKLKVALEMLAPMFQEMKAQGISPNLKALVVEVMGSAGFKDGARFFEFGDPPPQQQNPEVIQFMEEMKLEREKLQVGLKEALLELKSEEQRNREDNQTQLQIESMRGRREVVKQVVGVAADRESRAHEVAASREGRLFDIAGTREERAHETARAEGDARTERRQRIVSLLSGAGAGQKAQKPAAARQPAAASKPQGGLGEQALAELKAQLASQGQQIAAILAQLGARSHPGMMQPAMGAPYPR